MRSWRWYSKVLFALLVAAFAYWVWPTPWFYPPLSSTIVRVHRVTGEVQRTGDGYWNRMVPPWPRGETVAEHQVRAGKREGATWGDRGELWRTFDARHPELQREGATLADRVRALKTDGLLSELGP